MKVEYLNYNNFPGKILITDIYCLQNNVHLEFQALGKGESTLNELNALNVIE